jgi:S-adenosylmethionine hydrolase
MALLLFTDFGASDLYVGQLEAVFERHAPGVRVIHLLHEAPRFDASASAHLLAALMGCLGRGHVVLGVVDPGVGTDRDAVILRADGNTYVGPDNGLFAIIAARAATRLAWRLRTPTGASPSFHGRDVFAPVAAAIANGHFPDAGVESMADLAVQLDAGDLPQVIYVDHYGNAFTGIRARNTSHAQSLAVAGRVLTYARVFGEAALGVPFWYENSIGLVEIAINRGNAASTLGLRVGSRITWVA